MQRQISIDLRKMKQIYTMIQLQTPVNWCLGW